RRAAPPPTIARARRPGKRRGVDSKPLDFYMNCVSSTDPFGHRALVAGARRRAGDPQGLSGRAGSTSTPAACAGRAVARRRSELRDAAVAQLFQRLNVVEGHAVALLHADEATGR